MESNLKIKQYVYNKDDIQKMLSLDSGKNWPYVYLIHDDKKLYVGETQSIYTRTKQHLDNKDVLVSPSKSVIETIYDDSFNKSAILDIEQSLIQLFSAENKYELLNRNGGQSCLHNYYQKDYYHNEVVDKIWDRLLASNIASKPINYLRNSNIFKYSPYVSLTDEQLEVCEKIMNHMIRLSSDTGTFIVKGAAGTGKTVLSIYMLSLLKGLIDNVPDSSNSEDYDDLVSFYNLKKKILGSMLHRVGWLKIGFVVPMGSLRNTLNEVFKATGLKSIKVIGPADVTKDEYDILFVDEAHRLCQMKNIVNWDSFKKTSQKLGLNPEECTQLDWIMLRSKYTVLFYDENQTVRKSDLTKEQFESAIKRHGDTAIAELTSQMRCKGGSSYVEYIDKILGCDNPDKEEFGDYKALLFDNITELISVLNEKESEYGLSRLMAGYGWKWVTQGKKYEDIIAVGGYDIDIQGTHLIWNTADRGWICSEHAKDEVGCIHTTQGFDLNYAGIIFGPEIDYDPATNSIVINRDKFFDRNTKAATTDKELKQFIINAYAVMLKRGIKGVYLFAVNENMKQYLLKFFDKYNAELN